MSNLLEVDSILLARGDRILLQDFCFSASQGELVAVVGPNGSGKSTLLATLPGLISPLSGSVRYAGKPIGSIRRKKLAKQVGYLPQVTSELGSTTVLEAALIGRHPHVAFWGWESQEDVEHARRALAITGLSEYAKRPVNTLSGGERQRLAIATILTQSPVLSVLDEPLEPLDLGYKANLLKEFSRLTMNDHKTFILSIHDLSLAGEYAHRMILLDGQGHATIGAPREILTGPNLSVAYGCPIEVRSFDDRFFIFTR